MRLMRAGGLPPLVKYINSYWGVITWYGSRIMDVLGSGAIHFR